jgi:hypothetical protein
MSKGRSGAGRWLAWLSWLLIIVGVARLWADILFIARNHSDPFTIRFIAPRAFAAACLPLAGLALLFWRKPAGFYFAFLSISLAPVVLICDRLLHVQAGVAPDVAVSQLLFIILRSDVFGAVGCAAFLLGVPDIQQAYDLIPESDRSLSMVDDAGVARACVLASWMKVFCLFLLLPLLSLIPVVGNSISEPDASWKGAEITWQMISLAFALPLLVTAIIQVKYRHPIGIKFAVALLWLIPFTVALSVVAPILAPSYFWSTSDCGYIGLFSQYFGFNLIAALAWTAYLRKAPLSSMARPSLREADRSAGL